MKYNLLFNPGPRNKNAFIGWLINQYIKMSYKPISSSEAVELFRENPISCFCDYDMTPYAWPSPTNTSFVLDDIYVRSGHFPIGYLQNIQIDIKNRTAIIGHFAIEGNLANRTGLGRILAYSIFLILLSRFGTRKIIFSENSTLYKKGIYHQFFLSLNAVPKIVINQNRPDWHWTP